MSIKPFVKWVGGKGQLLNEISKYYQKNIEKYCEPFIGGGAVLFDILSKYEPKEILINDINFELINAYNQVKNNVYELIDELSKIEKEYLNANDSLRKEIYYNKRNEFNKLLKSNEYINKAVLFIFLNRTCFNGLYRVNSNGEYNVPQGKYKNPLICDKENLVNVSMSLKNVTIKNGSYLDCEYFIDKNTFVYLDPPYRPLPNTPSFTSYDKSDFTDKEQKELKEFIDIISKKGAKIVLSNSDPKVTEITDNFFDNLYKEYNIKRIYANRMINSNAEKRGAITELLIGNF